MVITNIVITETLKYYNILVIITRLVLVKTVLVKMVLVKMETQIMFKLTKEEKDKIRDAAKEVGLGMSPFIRSMVLRKINKEESE